MVPPRKITLFSLWGHSTSLTVEAVESATICKFEDFRLMESSNEPFTVFHECRVDRFQTAPMVKGDEFWCPRCQGENRVLPPLAMTAKALLDSFDDESRVD